MSFDTPVFLCCFLPALVLLHRCVPSEKGRNALLLVLGLLFYAFGSLQGLVLLVLSAAANYLLGLLILRFPGKKAVCALGVTANLVFLAAYQYLDFLLGEVLGLAVRPGLVAPVGISFFTFKAISYLVDAYRRPEAGTRRFWQVLFYLSFFPQVLAGPITRFSDFRAQLSHRGPCRSAQGLRRFIVGLGKKLIFSGLLAQCADGVFVLSPQALDVRTAWLGAVAYMLQIYFDFSGYSDMAIGLGAMLGFETPENFRYPYAAVSITDFWRRWHISLSLWFRDYLYIPLGGNRKGAWRTALNKFIVFSLCGLWHGAAWQFLFWGMWHGLLSALESKGVLKPQKWGLWGRIYTLLAVCLGFVLFRAPSLGQGMAVLRAMFAGFAFSATGTVTLRRLLTPALIAVLALAAVLCAPWKDRVAGRPGLQKVLEPLSYVGALALFGLCLIRMAAGGFAPFIYFQF